MHRLGIIIPYRNRAEHLQRMLPYTISYFRQKTDIEPLFVISEQMDDLPFNRGALLNYGYMACRNSVDYICFHDVDYLPVVADYSEPALPSRIIWWGMHERPVGHGTGRVVHAKRTGLAAVAVMSKQHFEMANGYANTYWGWGWEDTDLAQRLAAAGIDLGYRDGKFLALDHDSNGFTETGLSAAAQENEQRFRSRSFPEHRDGISALQGMVNASTTTATGLDGETATILWCKHDLGQMYAAA